MGGKLILEKQDLTYLSWSKVRNSSGTAGLFSSHILNRAERKHIISSLITMSSMVL